MFVIVGLTRNLINTLVDSGVRQNDSVKLSLA